MTDASPPWQPGDPVAAPCEDIETAKADVARYGYCLLANAIDPDTLAEARDRLVTQAEAERRANIAFADQGPGQAPKRDYAVVAPDAFTEAAGGVNQRVWMLVNKGRVFRDLVTHPKTSPVVESIIGPNYLLSTLSANIAKPGGLLMGLHTYQWWMPRPRAPDAEPVRAGAIKRGEYHGDDDGDPARPIYPPVACNVMFCLNDFTAANGATRLVPNSHRTGAQPRPDVPHAVPSIAAEAPAGTAIIFEGRTWHGTGANVANGPRLGLLATYCAPQFRTQENYTLGIDPAVVAEASPELLARLGFKTWNAYGRTGDPNTAYVYPPGAVDRRNGVIMNSTDLEARIDRLESIEAIKKLKHVYMTYCDLGYQPADLGPLFVDDGVWTSAAFGHHAGRQAIEEFFGGISAQIVFAAHLAMNFVIDVDGDTATGKWRILMPCTMFEDGAHVSRWILGDYVEDYVRHDGEWRFAKIDFLVNFDVPSLESWAGKETVRT